MTSLTGVNVIQVSVVTCSTTFGFQEAFSNNISPTPQYYQSKVIRKPRISPENSQLTLPFIAILYKSLGIGSTTILALAGVYGTVAFMTNLVTTIFLTDQWGRRK